MKTNNSSRVLLSVLALVAGGLVLSAAEEAQSPHRPDWQRVARNIVVRSVKLAPGERVLLHYDPEQDPELIAAIRDAIARADGIIVAEWTWPSERTGEYLASLSEEQRRKRAEAEDAIYRDLFARADVYLWMHVSSSGDLVPRRFENLTGGSKVRGVHSHWFRSIDPAENETLLRMYERAIAIDPRALDTTLAAMERKLRGSEVHITSPNGTDLRFKVPADAWFHRNTGDASREKVANARSVRDREEELPAGALRTTDVRDASGTLNATLVSSTKRGGVAVEFRNGRIQEFKSRGGDGDEIAKWYTSIEGDRDQVSELVIGANPELRPILPSGFMPYYGYGAGVIRIAIGDNWESGGKLRTQGHRDVWLFVTDGTLTANGVKIIENGNLVATP